MPDNAEYMSMATAELTVCLNAVNTLNNALGNLGISPVALSVPTQTLQAQIAAVQLNDPGD